MTMGWAPFDPPTQGLPFPGTGAPWCFLCLGLGCWRPTQGGCRRSQSPTPPLPQLAVACQTWVCGAEVSHQGPWAQGEAPPRQPPQLWPAPCTSPSMCPQYSG